MQTETSERSLLIIDDAALRRKAFAGASALLQKIDRLEETIRAFREEDQKLYEEWSALTFRSQRDRIERARTEYEGFVRFHNDMVTLGFMFDFDMPEAYRFLREEQERYDRATADERHDITKARIKREAFMAEELARQEREEIERRRHKVHRARGAGTGSGAEAKKFGDLGDRLRQMRDDEIEALFSRGDDLREVLMFVYTSFALGGDPETLGRFWKFASAKTRADFRDALRQSGLDDAQIPEDDDAPAENLTMADLQAERDDETAEMTAQEKIKRLYRLLVRRLHPDAQAAVGTVTPWINRAWEDLQAFVKRGDLRGMERLRALTVLRTESLNELSFSEILLSHRWVAEELHRRQREASALRGQPAWNFSKRKNFDTITRKIMSELARELAGIEEELESFRHQEKMLESMMEKRLRKDERKATARPRRRADRR